MNRTTMDIEMNTADIEAAARRIEGGVERTPCTASVPLSELVETPVYCKMESLQRTGSFKERGALNALLLLEPHQRERGVIAASAGNHALGLAWHGRRLGIPVTVVMPETAPLIKVATCQRFGARVIKQGADFAQAKAAADALVAQENLTYIHGFDDPAIIAGQGTVGMEILAQVPEAEAIVVPVGGGGLIAGIALAVKASRPEVAVYGVESAAAPAWSAALTAGAPVDVPIHPTLADGLAVGRVGRRAFALDERRAERVVAVDEAALALAIYRLMELEKSVVEGAGAAPLAALLCNALPEIHGRHTVLVLAGGNIDLTILDRVIEHGLVHDGRLCRFTARISDRPGGLARLASIIAGTGASIHDIAHDRAFAGPDMTTVRAHCVVETTDPTHIERLLTALRTAGVTVE